MMNTSIILMFKKKIEATDSLLQEAENSHSTIAEKEAEIQRLKAQVISHIHSFVCYYLYTYLLIFLDYGSKWKNCLKDE